MLHGPLWHVGFRAITIGFGVGYGSSRVQSETKKLWQRTKERVQSCWENTNPAAPVKVGSQLGSSRKSSTTFHQGWDSPK